MDYESEVNRRRAYEKLSSFFGVEDEVLADLEGRLEDQDEEAMMRAPPVW
jgi:hypothetical protein